MQQHPVPQNIASFKFKLFGNLTVRQFFTLIIPLSLAAVLFFSSIPSLIRLPLSFGIGAFAFFIALVPIGGRPFDQWAVSFLRAIMSPTQRVWIKESKVPEFLTMVFAPQSTPQEIPEEISSKKREKLVAYLKTLPKDNASPLDVKENIALQDIDFSVLPTSKAGTSSLASTSSQKAPPPIIWPKTPLPKQEVIKITTPTPKQAEKSKITTPSYKSGPQVQIPSAASPASYQQTASFQPSSVKLAPTTVPHISDTLKPQEKPKVSPHARPYILKGVDKRIEASYQPVPTPEPTPAVVMPPPHSEPQYVQLISEPTVNLASDTNYSTENVIPVRTPDNKIKLVHGIGTTRARKLHFAPPVNFDITKLPIRGEKRFEISDELKKQYQLVDDSPEVVLPIEKRKPIPKVAPTHIEYKPPNVPQKPNNPSGPTGQQVPQSAQVQKHEEPGFQITDLKKQELQKKQISSADIVPLTKTPNVISGQVADASGTPIAGAVLVIRDKHGIPIRALKTNKLGQFLSATPLSEGTYNIETESKLAQFKPFSITLTNKIVSPIAINAEGIKSG